MITFLANIKVNIHIWSNSKAVICCCVDPIGVSDRILAWGRCGDTDLGCEEFIVDITAVFRHKLEKALSLFTTRIFFLELIFLDIFIDDSKCMLLNVYGDLVKMQILSRSRVGSVIQLFNNWLKVSLPTFFYHHLSLSNI